MVDSGNYCVKVVATNETLGGIEMREYEMIKEFYGDRCAKRSGVPLMNHIDEGLEILYNLTNDENTYAAYCLHPLVQDDAELANNIHWVVERANPYPLALALEYRNKAQAYLCRVHTNGWTQSDISVYVGTLLPAIRHMLIADKLQNKKDFEIYHKNSHPNAINLTRYFDNWLEYLDYPQ